MITLPIKVLMLFAAGASLIISAGFVLYIMIGKVNRKLPEDQQIPYLLSFSYPILSKEAIIKRQYNRFYPDSRLFTVYIALIVLGFILILACAEQWSHFWLK